MKKFIIIINLTILLFLLGCSYSVYSNAYPHLKNIQISPFENTTPEYALGQEFQNYFTDKFQKDGRLKVVTIAPDSRIEGTILDYKKEILSYDNAGNISEYRVSILFSVQMTDLKFSQVIFENKAMLITETFSPNSTNPDILTTETQAQNKIFDKVFDTIIRSTLETW